MDENELENRLRRLGTEPVPGEVAARHKLLMSRRPLARGTSRNHLAAVAAAMAIVIGGGVAVAAIGDRSGPTQLEPVPALTTDPSATIAPTSVPADPFADDPCKGPPPFAGQTPEGDTEAERAANRAAESEAWEELKAQHCPAEQNEQPDQWAPTRPAPPEMLPRPSPEEPAPPEPMSGPPAPVPGPPGSLPGPPPEEPGPPDTEPGRPPNVTGPSEDVRDG